MTTRTRASLKARLLRSILSQIFTKPCPGEIPRTGDEGERVNCFAARVNTDDGKPYLLLDSLDGDLVKGRRWEGSSFCTKTEEHVRNLANKKLQVIHYYGLHTIVFTGVWDYLWHRYTHLIYFKIKSQRAWDASAQFLFNRRSLTSQRRVTILRLLALDRLSGNTSGLTYFDVMTRLYSTRWTNHPAHEDRSSEVEFHLESLVESGDASKAQREITYVATTKSLLTLEQFDEQDRRYRETSRLQLWIVFLTLILALAAVVQADIIRVPRLWDFTSTR